MGRPAKKQLKTKRCNCCNRRLPNVDEFFAPYSGKKGRSLKCRKCKHKVWYKWAEKNESKLKHDRRVRSLRRDYQLSFAEYEAFLSQQNYSCAICGINFLAAQSHVDHDHLSGKVRGLLCTKCNPLLGFAADNPEILMSAAAYLMRQK